MGRTLNLLGLVGNGDDVMVWTSPGVAGTKVGSGREELLLKFILPMALLMAESLTFDLGVTMVFQGVPDGFSCSSTFFRIHIIKVDFDALATALVPFFF